MRITIAGMREKIDENKILLNSKYFGFFYSQIVYIMIQYIRWIKLSRELVKREHHAEIRDY